MDDSLTYIVLHPIDNELTLSCAIARNAIPIVSIDDDAEAVYASITLLPDNTVALTSWEESHLCEERTGTLQWHAYAGTYRLRLRGTDIRHVRSGHMRINTQPIWWPSDVKWPPTIDCFPMMYSRCKVDDFVSRATNRLRLRMRSSWKDALKKASTGWVLLSEDRRAVLAHLHGRYDILLHSSPKHTLIATLRHRIRLFRLDQDGLADMIARSEQRPSTGIRLRSIWLRCVLEYVNTRMLWERNILDEKLWCARSKRITDTLAHEQLPCVWQSDAPRPAAGVVGDS